MKCNMDAANGVLLFFRNTRLSFFRAHISTTKHIYAQLIHLAK